MLSGLTKDGTSVEEKKKLSEKKKTRKRQFADHRTEKAGIPAKKKMFIHRTRTIILPNKFLLGGNITDPLNLQEIGQRDQTLEPTPQCSPVPVPPHKLDMNVIIPKNSADPLNLNTGEEIEVEELPKKKKKKKRKTSNKDKKKTKTKKKKSIDEIVSPAIPQDVTLRSKRRRRSIGEGTSEKISPVIKRKVRRSHNLMSHSLKQSANKIYGENDTKKKFIFGNYTSYYGYRNPRGEPDYRLNCIKREWVENKDVLDVGCNVGNFTLAVASSYKPKRIVGMDIDEKLINTARRNVRHYLSETMHNRRPNRFPISMTYYGPLAAPLLGHKENGGNEFPNNVTFVCSNYVPEDDVAVDIQTEEYDVILALSLTKWIHLNNGDIGLKRTFKRMYKQLRPGGLLILEPQAWPSYKRKKKLTVSIYFLLICKIFISS